MNKGKDIKGQTFNYLTAIKIVGRNRSGHLWLCKCKCGNEKIVSSNYLSYGRIKSCGCIKKDIARTRIIDISGLRFGKLYVKSVSETVRGKSGVYWNCLCDCGNHCIARGYSLKSGHTTSCGCNSSNGRFKKKKDTPLNTIFYGYKRSAKERGYSFNLTKENFEIIIKKNCYYCGSEPSQKVVTHNHGIYLYNGLDRKDPSIGYEKENVVPCCCTCNYAKRSMSIIQFKKWIDKIYNNLNNK